jgi:hypothetical protein
MDAAWSSDKIEKSMDAKEVKAVVREFGLQPMIRPDAAGKLCPSACKSINARG